MKPTIHEAVRALVAARQSGVATPALPIDDAQSAYAVQDGVALVLRWFGTAPPQHWKSGGPSRATPLTHAPLPPLGVWSSPANAQKWPFHMRGIEAEVALRLGRDVTPEAAGRLTFGNAHALVDAMTVSIEVVDTRWSEGIHAPALSKLADLQAHGALVLGAWQPFRDRDWSAQVCRVQIGDEPPKEFRGTHSLGTPLYVLPAWLQHATRSGSTIPAGTVVTTGTWCGLLQAQPGQTVLAQFEAIGEARVMF